MAYFVTCKHCGQQHNRDDYTAAPCLESTIATLREQLATKDARIYGDRELWCDLDDSDAKQRAQAEADKRGVPVHINVHGTRRFTAYPSRVAELEQQLATAQGERDGWHGVVVDCERLVNAFGTAESPQMSNLPNLIRDMKSRHTRLTLQLQRVREYCERTAANYAGGTAGTAIDVLAILDKEADCELIVSSVTPQPSEVEAAIGLSAVWNEVVELIRTNATHRNSGMRMQSVEFDVVVSHLRSEVEKLDLAETDLEAQIEACDVLGVLFHLMQKLGLSENDVQAHCHQKFSCRFMPTAILEEKE